MCGERWDELPEKVMRILRELEAAAGAKVEWRKVDKLSGKMSKDWEDDGPIVLFREYSHEGAAHELLHLLLDVEGFPGISRCNRWSANAAGTVVHNLLQHLMIFPRLRELGFDPDTRECTANESLLGNIQDQSAGRFEVESPHHIKAMYASILMRARQHCGVGAVDRINKQMCGIQGIEKIQTLARSVREIIIIGPDSTLDEYGDILDLCIKELSLDDILEARPPDINGSDGR